MTNAMTIADFTVMIEAKRAELANVNGKIDDLKSKRHEVSAASPHADDIVAIFTRGLTDASASFQREFASRLNDTFTGPAGAEVVARRGATDILRLEGQKPDREELVTRSMKGGVPDLNIGALTYFLRDQIAAEIPAMVDRLCPGSREGMKQVDRVKALQAIDDEIDALAIERDSLMGDLSAARAAVVR